jgi:hypothetical protein
MVGRGATPGSGGTAKTWAGTLLLSTHPKTIKPTSHFCGEAMVAKVYNERRICQSDVVW